MMRGSVFGNYSGANQWSDPGFKATASGIPVSEPGIALPMPIRSGQMYQVTAPNGNSVVVPQIDVGPAAWTQRDVDVSAGAAEALGYTPQTFPTWSPQDPNAQFRVER
jgi:hypothetical protein